MLRVLWELRSQLMHERKVCSLTITVNFEVGRAIFFFFFFMCMFSLFAPRAVQHKANSLTHSPSARLVPEPWCPLVPEPWCPLVPVVESVAGFASVAQVRA